ncbi:MAG: glutamine-hydrolyzing carbamoyl-phosphate synthase small subunit [Planctomycetota bacterium]|nr:glutamine-hydrolyzing carbamoyl-phosphate synthase small subunit [Planctomycetota bacterium]
MDGILLLEDGTAFDGCRFGARRAAVGEVVFNTSMTGYQEILTDPSYCRQIVALTASQIGNTGVNERDMESPRVQAAGLIVRELSPRVSSWRAEGDLDSFLIEHGVPGLRDVDTRALTRHIRGVGAMKGIIAPTETPREELEQRLAAAPSMQGCDLVPEVTCAAAYDWAEGGAVGCRPDERGSAPPTSRPARRIVAVDFGIKRSILRRLVDVGFAVTVVPASTAADEILAREPDGVFLSNGPGDPAAATGAIGTVRALLGRVPIFGICLGHQILALALGGTTFKLKFGHRGGNHPVQDLATGRVDITAQNHGFAVAPDLPEGVEVTQINLNDRTVEGLSHTGLRAFSVQYHPEAGPGPHEAARHFAKFRALVESSVAAGEARPAEAPVHV